jgi:hypothetical protein
VAGETRTLQISLRREELVHISRQNISPESSRSLCRPNILELCRRIKLKITPAARTLLHATCSAAIASAPNTINSKHAPIGLLLGTIELPRPFGCKNNAHRRSSNGGTGSNAIARLCLARPTFLNHFCKLMLRDGRCRLHNKINRALALMKCPGNEYLEGGTEPCCHHCLRCSEERSA